MSKVIYEVVEHDGGWAYKVDGVFSEPFPSYEDAVEAAEEAAQEQKVPGEDEEIEYQDAAGKWHEEHEEGRDRPETDVIEDPGH